MKGVRGWLMIAVVLAGGAAASVAEEEAKYDVVLKDRRFEIRDYAPRIVAEVIVDDTFTACCPKAAISSATSS